MKKFITTLAMICINGTLFAEVSPEHKKLLEKFFILGQAKESYENAMIAAFESAVPLDRVPEAQRTKMKAGLERVKKLMIDKLGWDKMKPEMMEVYAEEYSPEDLKEVLPILEKPEMQNYFTKLIQVMPKTMSLSQKKAMGLQAEIQKIMIEEMSKPDSSAEKKPASPKK